MKNTPPLTIAQLSLAVVLLTSLLARPALASTETLRIDGQDLGTQALGTSVAVHGDKALLGAPPLDEAFLVDAISGSVLQQFDVTLSVGRDYAMNLALSTDVVAIPFRQGIGFYNNENDPDDPRNGHPTPPGEVITSNPKTGSVLHVYTEDTFCARNYGASVALSDNLMIVGAPGKADDNGLGVPIEGVAFVYNTTTGERLHSFTPSDFSQGTEQFGAAVAIDSSYAVVGSWGHNSYQGGVWVYSLLKGEEVLHLENPGIENDYFGSSLAIEDGLLVIGAEYGDTAGLPNSGAVYIYDLSGQLIQQLSPAGLTVNDRFGSAVAINDGLVVAGSPNFGSTSEFAVDGYGQAFVFEALSGALIDTVVASDPSEWARFGRSVSIYGSTAVVGSEANAAYLFDIVPLPSVPGDTNNDGEVNVIDIVEVITSWGPCSGCGADLDGNGVVNVNDLVEVIVNWS